MTNTQTHTHKYENRGSSNLWQAFTVGHMLSDIGNSNITVVVIYQFQNNIVVFIS